MQRLYKDVDFIGEDVYAWVTMAFNRLSDAEDERLSLLSEECAEVIQIICKIQRHGYESHNPDTPVPDGGYPTTNRHLLAREIGDVLCALDLMIVAHDLYSASIEGARKSKHEKVLKYLHHQPVKRNDADRCLCGGVGCNTCEPQGRG